MRGAYLNSGKMRKWVLKVVSKFQDYPMVNKSEIVILLRHVWVYVEERKGLGRERREDKNERKRERRNVS